MAKMKAKQRNALPKKVFGIPSKRKFPLNDEAHVKAAVRLFGRASDSDKPALARKILSRAKTLGMDSSGWKTIHEWANKSSTVKESALIGFEHYFEESEELLIPDEDITIRKATKDDLDFIVEMELSTFSEKTKSHYPGIPEYCKRDAKKYLDSTEIIMDDDERIGIYMAYMDGDAWFISSIALLPEYQNRGIGSALIKHDIDNHDKIQLYVDIYNDKAKKLYEKLGFRVIEHDDDHWIMELDKKNNIKLVDATKDDIDYIYECELQTISDDEKKEPDFRKEVRKDAENSVGHTKIIMINGYRMGIYQAYATNKWGLKEGEKDWWYIAEIYVSPSARGKGIGTSIIETDISNHDKLLLNVLKENKKAIKLYKRLGFKIDKEFDNRYIMRLEKSTFQESTQHIQIGYRFTYNGEGIYEALKKAMFKKTNSSSAWMQFKNSTACTWLPVPPQYKGDDELNSYFTEEGRDKFKKLTIPYMKHYLDSDKIKEDKVDISSMEVVYSDEYQYVVKVFNLTVSYIKEAIKKIHDKTEKDSKPPTGNQNCQICTWCLEAQCRGIDAVPRAVYSPRDKGLAIYGPSIVIDPYKIRITDRNDVYDTVRKAGEGARFWVHVNWNQSTGGHEFMLINIDSKTYIADAQAGALIEFGPEPKDVETLRTTKDYFYEINFAHSYIVRLDNKKLNKKILDEATDESKTLPWDEKKDIEYMRREGLLTGEDEEHAKKTGLITEQFIEEAYRDEHHNKLYFHLSPDSYLDGQVFKPRVPEYLDRYDPEDKNFENDTTPRVCFSPSIEGCLNAIMVNMPRVHVMSKTKFYVYTTEKPFHEYKHKTNKELIRDKDIFDASVTDEVWILEPVRMKLYGVIEIDSVTNVRRKQNVPTISGKKSTRPYYKYKWHWLVKPKVLEKGSKFNYSTPRVIENLCMELPKFRYGLIRDGRLQTGNVSESDYDKYWVVHSPEEIDEAGGGNCWDMVEWEAGYLESYGVKYNKYFLSMEHDKKIRTHTFIVVKDHGKFIYIEQAFKRVVDEIGNSKEFDKLDDIFDYVIETSMEYDGWKECNYGIWDYTDIKFKVGTPAKNFMDYIITNGENVYEGNKSNRKKDDFK